MIIRINLLPKASLPLNRMPFRLAWTILFLLSFPAFAYCQLNSIVEEEFAYEVKQIDEFIERFNNENTLIKEYVSRHYDLREVKRGDLIKSLFDLQSRNIQKTDALNFIQCVMDPRRPVLLDFYDKDWFAMVKCSVQYQQNERKLLLILKIQQDDMGGSKWVIQNVYADFFITPPEINSSASLNPVSHGTDFLELDKAFKDAKNIKSYLPSDYQEDQLSKFIMALQNEKISFLRVEDISYHFLQIDGWILTVKNFRRPGNNSGWLISNLIPADVSAKENYKQQILKL